MVAGKGWCVWLTGLPGSGKTSIAKKLCEMLENKGVYAQILSSDYLRKIVTPEPKYTEEEREIVYRSLVFAAKLLTDNGINVIIDATGNRRKYRKLARELISKFIEAYIRCPLEVCVERETKRTDEYAPKNIYKRAFSGESKTVPGVGVPYEAPESPEVIVDSDKLSVEECARKVLVAIQKLVHM